MEGERFIAFGHVEKVTERKSGIRFGDGELGRVHAAYGGRRKTGTARWGPPVSQRERRGAPRLGCVRLAGRRSACAGEGEREWAEGELGWAQGWGFFPFFFSNSFLFSFQHIF